MKIYKIIKVNKKNNAHFVCFLSNKKAAQKMCENHKDLFFRTVYVCEEYDDANLEYDIIKNKYSDDNEE